MANCKRCGKPAGNRLSELCETCELISQAELAVDSVRSQTDNRSDDKNLTEKNKQQEKAPYRDDPDIVRCPKCHSSQVAANKQGFGWGKAVIGGVLTGGIGLLGGFIGSRNINITCLKCGHQFKPGE
jgi:hypothetical protein